MLMADEFGIENLGFLTLTFADNVQTIREAQKRFHSLNSHVIKLRYRRAIGVWERQKSGRIHFHLVVVIGKDIRTGFDFQACERRDYRSANQALRAEWAFWRKTAPAYRFGRTEVLPVKSNKEGIARYVGKYVSKHISQREERDKGARVVRFIGYGPGQRKVGARFSWATEGGWIWRHKVAAFCKSHGLTFDQLQAIPRWAYWFQGAILGQRIDEICPSVEAGMRSMEMCERLWIAQLDARDVLESKTFVRTYLLEALSTSPEGGTYRRGIKPATRHKNAPRPQPRAPGTGLLARLALARANKNTPVHPRSNSGVESASCLPASG
jgi:hypothetical protein